MDVDHCSEIYADPIAGFGSTHSWLCAHVYSA